MQNHHKSRWRPIAELEVRHDRRYDLVCRRWNPLSDTWQWRRFTNCWQHENVRGWRCADERISGWRPEWYMVVKLPPDLPTAVEPPEPPKPWGIC